MRQFQEKLTVRAPRPGLHDITREVVACAAQSGIATGMLTLFIHHTSASLTIQENADPDVLRDLEDFIVSLAPESATRYRHTAEGGDDMPAHLRTALTQTSLNVPMRDGEMALGTWQGIYLFEHRRRPQARQVTVHVVGD
jgi:secondary thiamine-phosphate synthase enzyme